jgi:hypothetical protein
MVRTIIRGISGALFVIFVAPAVVAQTPPPAGTASVAPAPATANPVTPAQPAETQAPQPDALPAGSATPPAPPPAAAPPPQPTYPQPAYAPPPQYYWAAPPYSAPAQAADATADATNQGPKRGPYFGAWAGVGGPFGGDTTLGRGAGYKEGVGVLATAGWAFVPNFGLGAFLHYNRTALALDPSDEGDFSKNSAYGLFYGLEARGIAGSGPFIGWASLGISLGSGTLTLESSRPSVGGGGPNQDTGEVTFKPMPVLAFGAEFEVAKGLGLGPHFRWYVVNVESACLEGTRQITIFDPVTGQPQTQTVSSSSCASSVSDVSVPDIVFLGVGLTYRIGT